MYILIGFWISLLFVGGIYIFTVIHSLKMLFVNFIKDKKFEPPFYITKFINKCWIVSLGSMDDGMDWMIFWVIYSLYMIVIFLINMVLYPLVILFLIIVMIAFYYRGENRKKERIKNGN